MGKRPFWLRPVGISAEFVADEALRWPGAFVAFAYAFAHDPLNSCTHLIEQVERDEGFVAYQCVHHAEQLLCEACMTAHVHDTANVCIVDGCEQTLTGPATCTVMCRTFNLTCTDPPTVAMAVHGGICQVGWLCKPHGAGHAWSFPEPIDEAHLFDSADGKP
jgi:hypothetical protein